MPWFVNTEAPEKQLSPEKRRVHGEQLKPGEVVLATDVYESKDGSWPRAGESFTGTMVKEGNDIVWVRPKPEPDCPQCHGPCCGADA